MSIEITLSRKGMYRNLFFHINIYDGKIVKMVCLDLKMQIWSFWVNFLEPFLWPDIDTLRPDINILRPDIDILRPESIS